MTEKRYTVIHLGNPVGCVIKDHASNNTIGVFSSMHNPVNEVCDLLNKQEENIVNLENRITQMQPFTVEAISVTHELNGKYQSALTSIGIFDEFLRDLNETFGDFEYTTGKAVFDLIYERFRGCCEYQLDKVNERL